MTTPSLLAAIARPCLFAITLALATLAGWTLRVAPPPEPAGVFFKTDPTLDLGVSTRFLSLTDSQVTTSTTLTINSAFGREANVVYAGPTGEQCRSFFVDHR